MRKIIGLHGLPGVGKDTIADHLCRTANFKRLAFGDAIKRELSEAFAVHVSLFNNRQTKSTCHPWLALKQCRKPEFVTWLVDNFGPVDLDFPLTPRWLMQQWGTGYRRSQDDHYWLNRLLDSFCEVPDAVNVIVTDVRFQNESDLVLGMAGTTEVWEVVRPNNPHHNKADRHDSNLPLPDDQITRIILNAGTQKQLEHKATRALKIMSAKC